MFLWASRARPRGRLRGRIVHGAFHGEADAMSLPFRTRRDERKQLASHLMATLSYLWIHALLSLALGALLGISITGERPPRPAQPRAAARTVRTLTRLVYA
jgi:hypothetical protein